MRIEAINATMELLIFSMLNHPEFRAMILVFEFASGIGKATRNQR
jgi:hypothetical protein